uniref:Uncharacterized protein n=1 Tax=Knipowitschia caucasica TaxID=637954 RepID=A0AAV2J2C1_KNICA
MPEDLTYVHGHDGMCHKILLWSVCQSETALQSLNCGDYRDCRGLQGLSGTTGTVRGLQGLSGDYRDCPGTTGTVRGLQGRAGDYRDYRDWQGTTGTGRGLQPHIPLLLPSCYPHNGSVWGRGFAEDTQEEVDHIWITHQAPLSSGAGTAPANEPWTQEAKDQGPTQKMFWNKGPSVLDAPLGVIRVSSLHPP